MKRLVCALALVLSVAVGCAGVEKAATPVDTPSCSPIFYEGEGKPDAIIVSDLPLRGLARETTTLMVDAIKLVLRQRSFRAGEHRIGYQSCNDARGPEGNWNEGLCERNAQAYARSEDVLGEIAPWNSGCTGLQLPILSRKTAGPLAMVSAANTYVGLTRDGPGAEPSHPDSLYPEGVRNYVRVVPPDDAQGAGLAQYASKRRMRRVVTVSQHIAAPYSLPIAGGFLTTARSLGLDARDFDWPERGDYKALARRVAATRPELVYLVGPLLELNAKQLVQALRAELGPNVVLAGSDAFLWPGLADAFGPSVEGMRATGWGTPIERLPPAGKRFLRAFGKPGVVDRSGLGAPEAAQAAEVLLDAIARSDGTRASVVEELFKTRVKDGILGDFRFDRNGDVTPATATVYRIHNGKTVVESVVRIQPAEGAS